MVHTLVLSLVGGPSPPTPRQFKPPSGGFCLYAQIHACYFVCVFLRNAIDFMRNNVYNIDKERGNEDETPGSDQRFRSRRL